MVHGIPVGAALRRLGLRVPVIIRYLVGTVRGESGGPTKGNSWGEFEGKRIIYIDIDSTERQQTVFAVKII